MSAVRPPPSQPGQDPLPGPAGAAIWKDATFWKQALPRAGLMTLVVFGLAYPILAYRTEPDIANRLVLTSRWGMVVVFCALALAGSLLLSISQHWRRRNQARIHTLGFARHFATHGPTLSRAAFTMVVLFPILVLAVAGPTGAGKWINNYGIVILIYVMLGWGLNIVVGLAGLLDLGYVAFYAVGAYTTALLSTQFGFSFWICLPLAGIFAAFWGVLLGFPVLRLRGDYLAIVTLAFGEIIRLVLINWSDVTGGSAGILSIPGPTFFGLSFKPGPDSFASTFGLPNSPLYRLFFLYYLILALALLTFWVTERLRRLPMGRAWEALREDETAARALGIDTVKAKLTAFAIGAAFGGLAGAFFAARQGFVSPKSFEFMESATILAIVVLGGMGSQIGVVIAAVVMIGGTELLREIDWLKAVFGQDFNPLQYRMLLFGLAMVVIMIWRPRGLISTREPTIFLRERKRISGDLVGQGHG